MEGINKIFCGSDVKNTGICECFFDPKLITGAIFVPKRKVFTATELLDANIAATLLAATLATKVSRIFPFNGFVAITPNTEDPTRQTFGYGGIRTVREGNYDWLFQFTDGGLNLSNALRTFNQLTGKYAVIFIESQNTLIGTSKLDENGEWGLAGVPMEDIYTRPWGPSDGTNVTNYSTQFTFKPVYVNENIAFKKVAVSSYLLADLAGIEDIKLEIVEVGSQDAAVRADTDCGSTDVGDLYGTELEQVTAWVVKNAAGEPKTVTGVVYDTDAKNWTISISENYEDGDTIQLAAPSVLSAAPINVVGYESDIVTVVLGSL